MSKSKFKLSLAQQTSKQTRAGFINEILFTADRALTPREVHAQLAEAQQTLGIRVSTLASVQAHLSHLRRRGVLCEHGEGAYTIAQAQE